MASSALAIPRPRLSSTASTDANPRKPHVSSPSPNDIAEFRLKSLESESAVFAIPGTDYRIELATSGLDASDVGTRVQGRVHGQAQRMHRTPAGGNFIEPLEGRPRIVQGTVIAVDPGRNEVLVDLVVPMRVAMFEGEHATTLSSGEMVNFYMEPGARFEPIDRA